MSEMLQRLRAWHRDLMEKYTDNEDEYMILLREAADRIKELEEHKRAQAEDIMTLGMTVGRLEAALREVVEASRPFTGHTVRTLADMAARALEGKHE